MFVNKVRNRDISLHCVSLFQACKGCIGTYKCDCTGIKGLPGELGIFGLRGSEGLPGDIGLEGPLGPKGEKGAAGEDGGPGEKGYRVSFFLTEVFDIC
jgi:hypothetical protein